MPAFSTHYIFAKSIEEGITEKYDFAFSKAAFYYGTQGPDFLFAHKTWRMVWNGENLVALGSELHHVCPSRMFALMKEYIENEPCDRDLVKSYIYGFLAHYALDRNTHPLVYAVQKQLTKAHSLEHFQPLAVHNQIELNIDTMLVKSELGYKNGIDFRVYETLDTNPYLIDEISALMAYVVPQITFCDASKDDFAEAFKLMRLGQIALGDFTGLRRKAISLIEKPLYKAIGGPIVSSLMRQKHSDNNWDYMNITHKEWSLPYDSRIKSTKSFMDLYREAQTDIFGLIDAFNEEDAEKAIREYSGDMSFDTGVRYDIKEPVA